MKLVSRKSYDAPKGDVPLICPVRNEMVLLPHFLSHHRGLGVENFIFIDNGSVDGTVEYLVSQHDCIVYETHESYRLSNFAANWINSLLQELCEGHWAVYLDCDEHLIYPECERILLREYCCQLSDRGFDTTYASMLDMYPEGDFRKAQIRPDKPVLASLDCYDADYVVRKFPVRPWRADPNPPFRLQIFGGPRCRLLSTLEREAGRGWLTYMMMGQIDRFIEHMPRLGMPVLTRFWPFALPAMYKQPLNFIRNGFRYYGSHDASNKRVSDELLAVLHFKFCDELNAKLDDDFVFENHYRRGLERFKVKRSLDVWTSESLVYGGTRRYRDSRDLFDLGLIGPSASGVWSDPKVRTFRTNHAVRAPSTLELAA